MTLPLGGEVAVVTGAAGSIGRVLALGLARAGASVIVADLNEAGAAATVALVRAEGGNALGLVVDITDGTSCAALAQAALAAFGPVSVLVNNAGVMLPGAIDSDGFMDRWRDTFRVNVEGPMQMVLALLPQLRSRRGRIVNLCSTSAYLATSGGASYGSSKAALVHLTRALAVELGADGIRVNGVAPGAVLVDGGMTDPALLERVYLKRTPTAHITTAQDLVEPVVFLASTGSNQVSGTILPVDGGYLVQGARFDQP